MKKKFTRIVSLLGVMLLPLLAISQSSFFTDAPEAALQKTNQKRVIIPTRYRTLSIDTASLLPFLLSLPKEQAIIANRNNTPVILLPMPDGSTARFHIWESSTMAPGLAERYPFIRTFSGQGMDDATATLKLDFTELGFHAQILSPVTSAVYIDPYAQGDLLACISYYKKDFQKKEPFIEGTPIPATGRGNRVAATESEQCIGSNLRTYRLAVACTGEYAVAATGQASPTRAQVLAAIITTVTRVNGIYEKELALRMVLVETEDSVVYTSASTDPFNGNNNANTLISESQTVIDNRIGNANYDMGHTFSTGGGGLSGLGIICKTGQKAQSITGSPSPVGDAYDVDYVAHEMGHAVGANHTFNSVLINCNGNGSSSTNTEPGSGTTIMAYAGICGSDDLQPHSDPQFQAVSLDEISTYTFFSTGNTCGTLTGTGNTPPVVNAGANYIVPRSTPFILTGSATDANGDALTYSWEEIDKGGPFGAWSAPSGNAPLFRSFAPVSIPTRYFPKISDVINNTTTIGEVLPSYARTMRFRLTARDNRAGGGGVCFDSTSLMVDGVASPFVVTAPTASGIVWYVNDFKTITWDASTTASAPISCANVTIELSTDGGLTFPVTLLASTPNDGRQEIQVPNFNSTTCRIRVMALGNVFYDMSNNNFTVQPSPTPDFTFNTPDTIYACGANSASVVLKTASLSGFSGSIQLTSGGNIPVGSAISVNPVTVAPGGTSTIGLSSTSPIPAGAYTVTISGQAAGASTKVSNMVFVFGGVPAPASLIAPAAYATGVKILPTFSWAAVAGASSYQLEISTNAAFSTIVQTISNGVNSYTLTIPLTENTTYFWRVKTVSICGISSPGEASAFRTQLSICNTFASTDVPKTISASGAPTVTSTLVIPAASGITISDINVIGLVGTHTWTADLTISLRSPALTRDTLLDRVCDGSTRYQNFNLNLDDQSSNAIPCNYIGGITVQPLRPLSVFNGQASAGTWTLTIKDNYSGDGGSLTGWGLQVCSASATPITYTFTGNGAWSNAGNWDSIGKPPAILPANCEIIINPVADGQCLLDISQRISAGAKLTIRSGKIITIPGSVLIQ